MSFDTERFIIEIQSRPSIWDTSSEEYSNREIKKKCWEEVVNIFGGEELDHGEKKELGGILQKRWKNLRSCFTREMKRQKTVKSGSGADARKSEYTYFKLLLFLQRVVGVRDEVTNSAVDDSMVQNSAVDNEVPVDRSKKTRKRKSTDEKNDNDDPFLKALNKSIETRQRREQDETDDDRMFLLSLLNTLKEVPREKKTRVKIQILTILNDAIIQDNHYGNYWNDSYQGENYRPGYLTQSTHNTVHNSGYRRNTTQLHTATTANDSEYRRNLTQLQTATTANDSEYRRNLTQLQTATTANDSEYRRNSAFTQAAESHPALSPAGSHSVLSPADSDGHPVQSPSDTIYSEDSQVLDLF